MPLSHDELNELRSISQTYRDSSLAEYRVIRQKQATRRKLFLSALLGLTALLLLMSTMEHWLPFVHSPEN